MTTERTNAHFAANRHMRDARWGYLFVASFSRVAVGFQFQILPALALPVGAGLGLTLTEIGALTGLYMAPGVVVSLMAGVALQRVAVRTVLAAALALMAVAGAFACVADGFAALAAARLLGGSGAVALIVAAAKGLYDCFDPRQLPLVNGVSNGAQPFGMGVALIAFGALGASTDWRFAFLLTALVSVVGIGVALLFAPGERPKSDRVASNAPTSQMEWKALLLAGAVVAPFVGCFYAFLSYFPIVLAAADWAPSDARLALGALGWAPIVGAPLGGWLASRTGRPMTIASVSIILWGGAAIVSGIDAPSAFLLAVMLLFGPLPIGVVTSLPGLLVAPEHRGKATGVFMSCLFAGVTVFPGIAAWVGERMAGGGLDAGAAAVAFTGAGFLLSLLPLTLIAKKLAATPAQTN